MFNLAIRNYDYIKYFRRFSIIINIKFNFENKYKNINKFNIIINSIIKFRIWFKIIYLEFRINNKNIIF